MPVSVSLLESLGEGGHEASIITSYSVYLPFYEDVLARRLASKGVRHNVLMVDAGQLAASLADFSLRPASAGTDYTLLPMQAPGAFHPKLSLFVGPRKATVFVGSHNVTLAGYTLNREVTSRTDWSGSSDEPNREVARSAWRAVRDWLHTSGRRLPKAVIQNVLAIEDIAPWLRGAPSTASQPELLYQADGRPTLWQQLVNVLPAKAKSVVVVGPFFDRQFAFLRALRARWPKAALSVLIDPSTVELDAAASRRIDCRWLDAGELGRRPSQYLHAKAMYVASGGGGDDLCLLGSANPSAPAWGIGAATPNDEAIVVWRGAEARSVAQALGIDDIRSHKPVAARDLSGDRHRVDLTETPAPPAWVDALAVASDTDVRFGVATSHAHRLTDVLALDENGDALASLPFQVIDGIVQASFGATLPEQVRLLRAHTRSEFAYLVCHHQQVRDAAARSSKQAQLRRALLDIGGDPQNLAELLSLVQHVVFNATDDDIRPAAAATDRQGRRASEKDGTVIETLEGSAGERRSARRRRHLAAGDLGYLLQVLISELGRSLPTGTGATGTAVLTEEELVGSDDDGTTLPTQDSDSDLAATCARKVNTLVTRTCRVLQNSAEAEVNPLVPLAQLAAVLSMLRALRQLERLERWRLARAVFVSEEARERLFKSVCSYGLGGRRPLFYRREVLDAGDSAEVSHLRGLLVWLAWECHYRADRAFAIGVDPDERHDHAVQRAALLELLLPATAAPDVREEAERSVQSTVMPRMSVAAGEWLRDHFAWSQSIAKALRGATRKASYDPERLPLGSIVAVPHPAGESLHVVAGRTVRAVVLIDFRRESGSVEFLPDRLRMIA